MVALGLLGRVPELETAVPDPSDPEDTAAYALDQRAEGAARDYAYDVVGRIDVAT